MLLLLKPGAREWKQSITWSSESQCLLWHLDERSEMGAKIGAQTRPEITRSPTIVKQAALIRLAFHHQDVCVGGGEEGDALRKETKINLYP